MNKIRNFKDLDIWKMGKLLVLEIYRTTSIFPKEELFGIVSQMRKAALSIPSNVAEGFNRFHNKEYRQFLFIALGSCAELETQVEISNELGYMNNALRSEILERIDHETRMIRNLIKKL